MRRISSCGIVFCSALVVLVTPGSGVIAQESDAGDVVELSADMAREQLEEFQYLLGVWEADNRFWNSETSEWESQEPMVVEARWRLDGTLIELLLTSESREEPEAIIAISYDIFHGRARLIYTDMYAGFVTLMIGAFEDDGVVQADDAHAEDTFENGEGNSVRGRLRIAPAENGAVIDGWMSFDGGESWGRVQQIVLTGAAPKPE